MKKFNNLGPRNLNGYQKFATVRPHYSVRKYLMSLVVSHIMDDKQLYATYNALI